jgi:hypothetical protein
VSGEGEPDKSIKVENGADALTKGALAALAWKFLIVLVLPILGYIALQTVSKPYYMLGKRCVIGNQYLQTVFVVNPGPWKNRDPEIEMAIAPSAEVIDYSGGVSIEKKDNKQIATVDGGLPPGCNFFVTCIYPLNSTDTTLRIVCDGKACKESPTVDLDIMMLLLILIGIGISLIAAYFALQYFRSQDELETERKSAINKALSALIEKTGAQSDINETIQALAEFRAGKGAAIKSKPLKKDNGKGKQKPPQASPL